MNHKEINDKLFKIENDILEAEKEIKVSIDILKQNSKLIKFQIFYMTIIYSLLIFSCYYLC